ncbi:hypothetical protein PU00_16200 [Hafnia alvei]|uniref:cellulose biosynthesis protein BcsC n=1 Tax=Hafnia alvei TaxID=569 RepID=UPI00058288A3|nr:cellulose biosynthesis protein BcsC [Hafnia alvei]KID00793.1 hypothetical protein PU00_16200 [Hafnia alvei]
MKNNKARLPLQRLGLTGICLLSLPWLASAAGGENSAVLSQLFNQAQYWHERGHPDDAKSVLKKVLSVDPNNAEALYLLALYSLQQGNKTESSKWKQQLQQVSPDSGRLQDLDGETTAMKIAPAKLEDARRLARSGNPTGAAAAYEALFKEGMPVSSLENEYYQTLAAIPERREEAIQALQQRYQNAPNDRKTALALGQILTYQESSRRDGIAILSSLGASSPEADKALRQALLWLHPKAADRELYEAYQQGHPDDAELAQHFSNNVTGNQVASGFDTVNKGDLKDASAEFQRVLDEDPHNSNAIGGLGIIAMRQGKFAQALDYLNRAAAEKGADSAKWQDLANKSQFYLKLDAAKDLARQSDWNGALAASEPLLSSSGDEKMAVALFRADILRRKGDLAGAEQAYRALSAGASTPDIQKSLYYVLKAENKSDEALELMKSMPASFQHQLAEQGPVSVDPLRHEATRAMQAGDTLQAERLLRQAMAKQPTNVWVRLDLARVLKKQGDAAQAEQILAPALQSQTNDGIYVFALYQAENQHWDSAISHIDRIPRNHWNADIKALRRRAAFNQDLAQADSRLAQGDSAGAAALLLPLSHLDISSPSDAGHLAASLYQTGQTKQAVSVVQRNMRLGVKGSAGDYAQQIDVLNKAGLTQEADAWMSNPLVLSRSSATDIERLKSGTTIREVDRLREEGQYSRAWDLLIVKLHDDPNNTGLMLAMARVYQSGKMFNESRQIYQHILGRNSQNKEARIGAINLALAEGDNQQATQLLSQLPDDNTPEHLLLAARVARSNGDSRTALALLRKAKSQLQGLSDGTHGSNATINGLPIADNPFVDETPVSDAFRDDGQLPWQRQARTSSSANGQGAVKSTQTIVQVSKLLDEMREKLASWTESAVSLRSRDGESGLGALTETKTSLAFSTVPFWESRLKFSVTPVMLNAGSSSGQSNNRFGTGALQQATAAWKATQESLKASGESVDAANAARKALADKSAARIKACQDPTSASCEIAMREETDAQDAYNLAQQQVIQPKQYGPDDFTANSTGSQRRSGAEIALSLSGDNYQADIGTTPLGQDSNRLLGGLRWSPTIAGNTQMTMNVERRAVTDSLLSYVGAKDKYSGKSWGAVTKSGGGVSLSYDDGQAGAYGGASYYQYQGNNVADNSAVIGNAGIYFRPLHLDDRELKVGVNADYMNFSKNLSNFSFGQGGYFSPQDYISISLPIEYSRNAGNWDYKLSGSVGYQSYSQKQSDYFPTRPDWQNNLDWLVDEGYGRESHYAAKNSTGVSYNTKLQGNYKFSPQLSVGGQVGYDTVGEYSEATAQLYFKYLLDN